VLGAGQAACALGTAEVPSQEVGLAILSPLRDLDEVAYLRFGSVYRSFSSIEDFEKEIRQKKLVRGTRHHRSRNRAGSPQPTEGPSHDVS
jgi:transcriptional regulator NrdR family protein